MQKISSGIKTLDMLIDHYHIGDNVVWEIDAGVPFEKFLKAFIRQSIKDNAPIIYVSFNRSPQTIYKELADVIDESDFTLVDCFTSGKGRNDGTFVRFYNSKELFKTIRFDNPSDIEGFKVALNALEDRFPSGSRYIFDSLTGMQDLWSSEEDTYKLFTFMCPRLYDLQTVAYWILEKDAHSPVFRANLRHITQVVFELYRRRDSVYIKAHKLSQRELKDIFKPHHVKIQAEDIDILPIDKPRQFYIGEILRNLRGDLNMSQKELAEKLDVSPSFISQLESNQISPSIHTLLELCDVINVPPSTFFRNYFSNVSSYTVIRSSEDVPLFSTQGYREFDIINTERLNLKKIVLSQEAKITTGLTKGKRQEIIFIINGVLSFVINGKTEIVRKGDCLYFSEVLPKEITNKGGENAEFLLILF